MFDKNYFWDENRDRIIWNIKSVKFVELLSVFGTNLGLEGGKQLIKIIFDKKVKIGIFDISNVPNFNKLGAFLILGPI